MTPHDSIDALILELTGLTAEARSLQAEDTKAEEVRRVSDGYNEWLARSMAVMPAELKENFRDAYEGGQFTSRIKAYFSDPSEIHPMYKPGEESPLIPKYRYEFGRTFRDNANSQRQLLKEAQHMVPSESDGLVTEVTSERPGIFVVHGHATAELDALARFIDRVTDRDAVVLKEQASGGRTIIEKLETNRKKCDFAVVLMTPDDIGGAREGGTEPRARQNVIFETGYFVAAFGRERVVLLVGQDVEKPSDLDGVVYIPLVDDWRLELLRELQAADIEVDLNKI